MKKITEKITRFIENFKNVHAEARKIGFAGVMRLIWKDLFVGRSLFQWLYLIALSSVPLILEFTQNTESHDWIGLLALTAIIWIGMGLAYQSISSARPFRDSVTDATNGVGQLLMTRLYREQWIFWIATNLFSIYLWWGENIHIQGMYWVYTLNSLVGWYQWTKAVKEG